MRSQTVATVRRALPEGMTISGNASEVRVSFNVYHAQRLLGCDYGTARDRCESVAYYTDDLDDALGTAQIMARAGLSLD